jgi:putative ABC transport system permease protein
MHILPSDIRTAVRTLTRSPAYTAVTILTLALAIGANTAIFSVISGVILKPLPYPRPDRLRFISSTFPAQSLDRFWVSPPEWAEFRERTRSFQDVGAYRSGAVNLGTPERPRRVTSSLVTPQLLTVLGVPPLGGRLFTDGDSLPAAEDVAILAYSTWQSDFGGDERTIGRVVPIDGVPTRIVGIMPRGFDLRDERVEVYLPLTLDPAIFPNLRASHFLYLIGRLKDGVTPQQAQADLDRMIDEWRTLSGSRHAPNRLPPSAFPNLRMRPVVHLLQMKPLEADTVGSVAGALWVLQGAVGFVLLIACANLANLILARAESRHKEFAICAALGAGRLRLLRQFLTEGVLVAVTGGALGTAVGFGELHALLAANPDGIPRALEITVDWRVLLFTLGVSLLTGLAVGLAPLIHLRTAVLTLSLKEGNHRATPGSARARVRSGLVMAEVALAVVLVVGAGLLLRTFHQLMTVDAGFSRQHLTTFGIVLPPAAYAKPEARTAFFDRLLDRLGQLPGVTGAAAMTGLPPDRILNSNDVDIEGYTPTPDQPPENIDYFQTVTRTYLETMGIPVVRGRGFEPTDISGGPVVLVNETLAKRVFGDRGLDAVGQRVKPYVGFGATTSFTIVGVVRDVKQGGIARTAGTELYLLNEQGPRLINFAPGNMNVAIRSVLPADTLARAVQRAVGELDASLPIVKLRTMEQVFADSVSRPRFLAVLLTTFAGLALALAAIGTYGILSYSVAERTQEIGIHMALGATPGSVLGLILSQGMRLTIAGLAAGLLASAGLTRLLRAQLFNVTPTDPATLALVTLSVAAVAFIAAYVPARRATRVDPIVTLRDA